MLDIDFLNTEGLYVYIMEIQETTLKKPNLQLNIEPNKMSPNIIYICDKVAE